MGEEAKKPEEKKPEETKKPEEEKKEPKTDEKKDEKKPGESKETPPPPPQEIVLRVFMHCEGCARKVRRCLKGFEGVEDVQTDCKTHKVVVKGEKADPLKVLERIQKKSHRQVELLSPIPKPPTEEPKKVEEKQVPKPEEKKKEEPQVITVVFKVHMHCEACAQEIRKRILRMKGVESAEPDLKSSQVTVKGAFEAPQLVEYVYKRTGKHAVIVKQDPPEKKKEEADKGKDGKEEKKGEEGEKKEEKKAEEGEAAKEKKGGGGEAAKPEETVPAAAPAPHPSAPAAAGQEEPLVVELRKNEFYYYYPQNNYQVYPPRYAAESGHAYPPAPQMFSDENPNACSVM